MSLTEETRNFQKITFTNAPKIKKKPYKKRSVRKTCEELVASFYPDTEALYGVMKRRLVQKFDRCNRRTILAYLGRPATTQVQKINHDIIQRSGNRAKEHRFTRRLPAKKGYLELFGLASLMNNRLQGKTWFKLHHTRQTILNEVDSPLRIPPSESFALKEVSKEQLEFKAALAYAKKHETKFGSNKNYLPVIPSKGDGDETPVLQVKDSIVRDGDERESYTRDIKFKVSESNREINNKTPISSESELSEHEKRVLGLGSSCKEASR